MSSELSDFVKTSKGSPSMTSLLSNASTNLSKGLTDKWAKFTSSNSPSESGSDSQDSNGWFSQAQQDPCLPSLSKKQRILGFMTCLFLCILCFFLCSLYIPLIVLKARKFALLYSMGSLFFILSFAALWGPVSHFKHLFSGNRLPFSCVYFFTLFATLYFSMWRHSYIFTIICVVLQIMAMIWYIVSYIPGGQTGLKFFTKVFYSFTSRTVSTVLPV